MRLEVLCSNPTCLHSLFLFSSLLFSSVDCTAKRRRKAVWVCSLYVQHLLLLLLLLLCRRDRKLWDSPSSLSKKAFLLFIPLIDRFVPPLRQKLGMEDAFLCVSSIIATSIAKWVRVFEQSCVLVNTYLSPSLLKQR